MVTELEDALACAKRIFDFIDTPSRTEMWLTLFEVEKADGSVNVENISFSSRKEVPLLQNIPIDVRARTSDCHRQGLPDVERLR